VDDIIDGLASCAERDSGAVLAAVLDGVILVSEAF
jgi:hypothetical protein